MINSRKEKHVGRKQTVLRETAESVCPQDDMLEAWLDRAQKVGERMAIDEDYPKEVAREIS
jgi:hypothetical protein